MKAAFAGRKSLHCPL